MSPHRYAKDEEAKAAGERVVQSRKKLLERLSKLKNYWCIWCENIRTHQMVTEELGICPSCGRRNFAPTGEGGN